MYYGAACILTVIIECGLLWGVEFRNINDLAIVALTNIITNVALNLILVIFPAGIEFPWVYILEIIVIAVEYLIYRRAFGPSARLLIYTAFANILSFGLGIVVFEVF